MRKILSFIFCLLVSTPSFSQENEGFKSWLEGIKQEAQASGILTPDVQTAIDNIQFDSEVIALDGKQPEKTSTLRKYQSRVLTDAMIERAASEYQENVDLLRQVESRFSVPAEYIVALWGIESHFGENTGIYSALDSLASLAYEGRRAEFFRKELMNSLKILAAGEIGSYDLTGSWAGAMGQCQFMPSSYLKYAYDFDGDGKRDIWNTRADVFGSIANYLKTVGWDSNTWGYKARIPANFDMKNSGRSLKLSLDDWASLGVKKAGGSEISGNTKAALVVIDEDPESAYLVFSNFDVIMDWNRSVYFATTVGMLAEKIKNRQVESQ